MNKYGFIVDYVKYYCNISYLYGSLFKKKKEKSKEKEYLRNLHTYTNTNTLIPSNKISYA